MLAQVATDQAELILTESRVAQFPDSFSCPTLIGKDSDHRRDSWCHHRSPLCISPARPCNRMHRRPMHPLHRVDLHGREAANAMPTGPAAVLRSELRGLPPGRNRVPYAEQRFAHIWTAINSSALAH